MIDKNPKKAEERIFHIEDQGVQKEVVSDTDEDRKVYKGEGEKEDESDS